MTEDLDPKLAECLREPIHLAGAIQPHGYLVSCTPGDWVVRHVSANIEALLGAAPDAVVGEPLREFVDEDVLHAIDHTITFSEPGGTAQRACVANVGQRASLCDLTVHLADGLVHVEIEPQPARTAGGTATAEAQAMIARVVESEDPADFHQRIAEQVRLLTGFDRVMVYRFREDDSGEVIAESCDGELEPYLGLRYPATDIPPQARALYLRNRLRVIPDAGYAPVALVPAAHADGAPLDLSQHVLRSVSPVHLEYLRNMGVAASMSISIISGGRLWGLIACHHRNPRAVSPAVRAATDLFGMFVSMRVSAREQEQTMARYERAQQVRDALAQRLSLARDFDRALVDELDTLRVALDSDGAALWLGGRWHGQGRSPASANPGPLLEWLRRQGRPVVAMSDRADDWNVPALHAPGLAGLLAVNLGAGDDWLFLFRAEQVEQVRWAGEPTKAVTVTDDGSRIAPRKSFATWRETVRGRSAGWSDSDRRGAARLSRVLREQRRRAVAHGREMQELDGLYQRQALRDQKQRLDHIAMLLDGLVHLDDSDTRRIGARIARLETDLRDLMRSAGEPSGRGGDGAARAALQA